MEEIYLPRDAQEILITSPDVNRPGLFFAGYENYFDNERINFIGITEAEYLNTLSEEVRAERVHSFMSSRPAAIVVTRGIKCPEDILSLAHTYEVPVLGTNDSSLECNADLPFPRRG